VKLKHLLLCAATLALISCDVRIDSPTEPSKDKGVVVVTPTPVTNQVVINSFTGEPVVIAISGLTTLRWSVSGPLGTACRIDPAIGDVPTTGFASINLVSTTAFTLLCSVNGLNPVNRFLIITVIK